MADGSKIQLGTLPISTKVSGINYTPPEFTETGVTGGYQELLSFRAVDKIAPLQMTDYQENVPPQAGRPAGISNKTIWA